MTTTNINGQPRKTPSRLSQGDTFKALKMLEEHGKMVGEFFEYEIGWDDDRVAKELGCSVQQIEYRRKEVFGNLKKARHGRDAEIEALEARVETLDVEARALRVKNYELTKRMESAEKAINLLLMAPALEHNQSNDMRTKLKDLKAHYSKTPEPVRHPGNGA